MVSKQTLRVRTPQDGLLANVPGKLIDSATYTDASLTTSSVITKIKVYSENGSPLDENIQIYVGYQGNISEIISGDIGTNEINECKLIIRSFDGILHGLTATRDLYVQTNADLVTPIGFEIIYFNVYE
jgi:hypothetical protein